jgi:hypothetical protein
MVSSKASIRRATDLLPLRSGPGAKYRELDRLYNGEQVYSCNERAASGTASFIRSGGKTAMSCRHG